MSICGIESDTNQLKQSCCCKSPRGNLCSWVSHGWNTQFMTKFSNRCCLFGENLILNSLAGPFQCIQYTKKQTWQKNFDASAFTPFGSPPAMASGLGNFMIEWCASCQAIATSARSRHIHFARFHPVERMAAAWHLHGSNQCFVYFKCFAFWLLRI